MLTDSETSFNVIIRNVPTTEKRLMINIKAAREAYNEGIVENIIWIRRNYNLSDALADAMTKSGISTEFLDAIRKVKIHFEVERSITTTKVIGNKEKENA